MPKKKDDTPPTQKVSWIKNLPEQGGAWGRSILDTVNSVGSEIEGLEKQKAEIEQRAKKEKAEVDEKLKTRRKIVTDAVKRADKEAQGLFNEKQIQQAKDKVPESGSAATTDTAASA